MIPIAHAQTLSLIRLCGIILCFKRCHFLSLIGLFSSSKFQLLSSSANYPRSAMALNVGDFNITDSQQLAASLVGNSNPNKVGDGSAGASQMLTFLQEMRAEMQSISGRLTTLEKNQETPEETVSRGLPAAQHDTVV